VRRVALTLRADALEDVLDALMPLLPHGVYQRDMGGGRVEVAFYGDAAPEGPELDALAGAALLAREEEDVPDSREARRARVGHAWEVAGRLRVRSPLDAPGADGLPEIVIEPLEGAFGTGAHPTTRMTLELLLGLEPAGGFADLGCGAGLLAIVAARLGWEPVFAVDVEPRAVESARRNAERNGVEVRAVHADLLDVPPPPARTLAGNMPFYVHQRAAPALDAATEHVIASGVVADQAAATAELYAAAGLTERARLTASGWAAIWLAR
jgi:ribosomal protein L11 methyltransferase